MKLQHTLAAVALGAAAIAASAAEVGVSINFAEPGVYGRVDIGRFPQPVLVAPKAVIAPLPVVVGAPRVVVAPAPVEPMYLWVPPGHRAHWERHCGEYHACGRPVYFVDDRWYHDRVMARREERREERHEERREEREEHDHGKHKGNKD